MPPLAATVAAGLALRAGISLARTVRERRDASSNEQRRRVGLAPQESVAEGLQRMAIGQLDLAIETVEQLDSAASPEKSVHETRKALKRLRALLRLLEPALTEDAYAREQDTLREAGRRLSRARDADVLLATLDGLIDSHPGRLSGRGGVIQLRAHLRGERDRAWRAMLADDAARQQTLAELRACRVRVAAWQLLGGEGVKLVEPGFTHVYRQGRKRYRRAVRARRERTVAMHRWRKRVKDLRYAAEMLRWREGRPAGAGKPKGRRARRRAARARKQAAWLRRMARRADDLGEVLGQEHDLAALADYVRSLPEQQRGGASRVGRGTRRRILKLIAARRRKLSARALREGERLYARRPSSVAKRLAATHARARPPLS